MKWKVGIFLFFLFIPFLSFPPILEAVGLLKAEKQHVAYIYRCVWLALFFCCSAAKSCLTVYDSMDCSMPGFLVLPSLLEFAQTHVHWGNDAIESSHPLSLPSPPAFSLSQHQGLFQWVSSLHQVVLCIRWFFASGASASDSALPMNIQDWFPLGLTDLISLLPKGLSGVFCSTTIWKHQIFGAQSFLWSKSHYATTGKTITLTVRNFD